MYVLQSEQFGATHGGLCQSLDKFGGKPSLCACQQRQPRCHTSWYASKIMASTANNKHINGKTQLAIICGQSLILFFVAALQLLYWLHNMANLILLDLNH